MTPQGRGGNSRFRIGPDFLETIRQLSAFVRFMQCINAATLLRHRTTNEMLRVDQYEAILRAQRFAFRTINHNGGRKILQQFDQPHRVAHDMRNIVQGDVQGVVAIGAQEGAQLFDARAAVQIGHDQIRIENSDRIARERQQRVALGRPFDQYSAVRYSVRVLMSCRRGCGASVFMR